MTQKRKVKRTGSGGRQAIVRAYHSNAWYELPDWASEWVANNAGWVALGLAVILTPIALLAIVLGVHALPLDYLGIPVAPTDNSAGLAAAIFIIEFFLLLSAVRPLLHQLRSGWVLVIIAAIVQAVHGLVLHHGITSFLVIALVVYLYTQVRHRIS